MSSSTETLTAAAAAATETTGTVQVKVPLVSLLLAAVLGAVVVLAGAGGALYYLARAGKLPNTGGAAAARPAPVKAEPASVHLVAMEPLVVNLADPGGKTYLRLVVTLRVEDASAGSSAKAKPDKGKESKEGEDNAAAIRDTVLAVLGTQTADALLAADGKVRLKSELKAALAAHVGDMKVREIYFTEFLVQR